MERNDSDVTIRVFFTNMGWAVKRHTITSHGVDGMPHSHPTVDPCAQAFTHACSSDLMPNVHVKICTNWKCWCQFCEVYHIYLDIFYIGSIYTILNIGYVEIYAGALSISRKISCFHCQRYQIFRCERPQVRVWSKSSAPLEGLKCSIISYCIPEINKDLTNAMILKSFVLLVICGWFSLSKNWTWYNSWLSQRWCLWSLSVTK